MIPPSGNQYYYKAFGIQIASEIQCPELLPGNEETEVYIKYGPVPKNIDHVETTGPHFQSSENEFLLHVNGIAHFLVKDGKEITIEPFENTTDDEVRLFLLGSAFGALIQQRGLFPLHGSAIEMNGECVVFSGVSGIGKSTIAFAFARLGYKILTDDLCVISLDNKGIPLVQPGYPQMKLWADTLQKVGKNTEGHRHIRPGMDKYGLLLKENYYSLPLPLKRIYLLSAKKTEDLESKPLIGIDKFNALINNTYRFNFIAGSSSKKTHFKYCDTIAQNTFIATLSRPSEGFRLEALIEYILSITSR
jgi:hypothetical protein